MTMTAIIPISKTPQINADIDESGLTISAAGAADIISGCGCTTIIALAQPEDAKLIAAADTLNSSVG